MIGTLPLRPYSGKSSYLFSQVLRLAVFSTAFTALAARFSLSVFPGFFAATDAVVALFAMVQRRRDSGT
jgi:hypothetical protein